MIAPAVQQRLRFLALEFLIDLRKFDRTLSLLIDRAIDELGR